MQPSGLWRTFPPEYVKFSYMEELNLSGSSLEGTLPPEYVKFTYMEELNLSANSLTGTIPLEFLKFVRQKVNITLDGNY